MRVGRIVLIVFGCLGVLVGLLALAGGGAAGWAYGTQRDGDGYFQTRTEAFSSPTRAITSDDVDVWPDQPFEGNLGTVRLRVSGVPGRPVFVGIARTADLDRYLAGVAHDRTADIDLDPFRVTYDRTVGTAALPTRPDEQAFWVARAAGTGRQTITWDVASGNWSVAVLNADGSPGVNVDASLGGKVSWLLPVIIGLLVFGALSVAGGVLMIVLGARGTAVTPAPAQGAVPAAAPETEDVAVAPYPVHVTGELTEPLSRWLWLVKWLLALPHLVVLMFLWIAWWVLTVVAFFAILFTGRYPREIFDFNVGVLRWTWRVNFYATSAIGTDRYPPFSLGAADYPATLEVEYPERLSRGRVLVKWWLLAIPHYLVVAVLTGGLWASRGDASWALGWGGGLIGLLTIFAGVVLLFTGRYPRDIFVLLMGFNRWVYRVIAYAGLMRDEYPPFRLRP